MDLILYEAFSFLLTAGLVLLASPFAARRQAGPLLAFIAVAMLQTLAVTTPLALGWHLGQWNWIGKFASIATGLAAIRVLRLTRDEIGLVLPRGRTGWLASIAGLIGGLALVILFVLVLGPNPMPNIETLAYQATMPGLDEELAFRGIGMALLARGFPATRFYLPVWALPVAITSLQFTMVHVLYFKHGHLGLAIDAAGFVLPMGLLYALVRVRSSSLLGCVPHAQCHQRHGLLGRILPAGNGALAAMHRRKIVVFQDEVRAPAAGCIHYSDGGSQYASEIYRTLLASYGSVGSMSRRDNSCDNAKAESFMKTLKVEAAYLAAYETFEDVTDDLPRFTDKVYDERLYSASALKVKLRCPAGCRQRN